MAVEIPELEAIIKSANTNARVLLFDIETSPMEVYVWGLYKQRISPDNVIKPWACLSWAAKWLCEDKVLSAVVKPKEAIAREDYRIIRQVWALLNEADVVIGHNADAFDIRKLNARFIINGLKPPMPYVTIDTLKVSRRMFSFYSHKLDMLNKQLDLSRKLDTSFGLWTACVGGDKEALKTMEEYNRQDVVALEDLYFVLRPWIKSHPNMGIFVETDEAVCPNCGSEKIEWGGSYVTPAGEYKTFRCECGAIGRSRHTALTKEKRQNLTRSVAR
jgi:hypothetical protein